MFYPDVFQSIKRVVKEQYAILLTIVITGFLFVGIVQCSTVLSYIKKQTNYLKSQIEENKRLQEKISTLRDENKNLKHSLQRVHDEKPCPGISQAHLNNIITSTLRFLQIDNIADWKRLILLTIATESDMGRLLKQVGGPARGVVQIEPATERETLSWLSQKRPELFQKIRKLRAPARLSSHEAEWNLSYAVALCYSVYHMRRVDPVGKDKKELAALYKKYYNTVKGKATIDGVLYKLTALNVKI